MVHRRFLRACACTAGVLLLLVLAACATGGPAGPPAYASHHASRFAWEQALRLGAGVNIGDSLEATPDEAAWGNPIDLRWFELIYDAGFRHVRIPIRWSLPARTSFDPPYAISPAFFRRVDEVVDAALGSDLMVIINVHHFNEPGHDLFTNPDNEAPRFLAMWRQIARHYRDEPNSLLYELLNEPNGRLTSARWYELAQETVAAIREIDDRHTIVIDSPMWGSLDGLRSLVLPSDPNIIASFHFYDPMQFTHQGASWITPVLPLGVLWPNRPPYPTNRVTPPTLVAASWYGAWYGRYDDQRSSYEGDPAYIARRFDEAAVWSRANDARCTSASSARIRAANRRTTTRGCAGRPMCASRRGASASRTLTGSSPRASGSMTNSAGDSAKRCCGPSSVLDFERALRALRRRRRCSFRRLSSHCEPALSVLYLGEGPPPIKKSRTPIP